MAKNGNNTALKVRDKEQVPADTVSDDFLKEMLADAGEGTSQKAEDNVLPLMYVLQGLSPQVNKRNDAYIEGAEVGDIWLKNAPQPIFKGNEGVIFIPCHQVRCLVEWIPRDSGGGFVTRHFTLPHDAIDTGEKQAGKSVYVMPNGNTLVETVNRTGFAIMPDGLALPYMIPMKSTNLGVSNGWNTIINQKQKHGLILPSYSWRYRLTTVYKKNDKGEWYLLQVANDRELNDSERELYRQCKNLKKACDGNKVSGEAEEGHAGVLRESADAPM
jgi:hypothetical protein